MRVFLLFLIALLTFAPPAQSLSQPRSTSPHKASASPDSTTQILVLATPHLEQMSESFSPSLLDSLHTLLASYNPHIIGIEALSGPQIADMKRRGGAFTQIYKQFAQTSAQYGAALQETLGISWREAQHRSDSLITHLGSTDTPSAQTRLDAVSSLLAAYRLHTAALQWSYVSQNDQASQSLVPDSIASGLDRLLRSPNERASISLRLAHALDRQRVFPIDDHMEKADYLDIVPALKEGLSDSTLQAIRNAPYRQKSERLMGEGTDAGRLLPVYRYMNSPDYLEPDVDAQWRIFLRTDLPSGADRSRLAYWETRNLNIAARVRRASAQAPGGRVLITIGASHKSFLDRYFDGLMGVEVVHLHDLMNH